MIDNEKEVRELIAALNDHLPMRAYATPPLVQAVRPQQADFKVTDALQFRTQHHNSVIVVISNKHVIARIN